MSNKEANNIDINIEHMKVKVYKYFEGQVFCNSCFSLLNILDKKTVSRGCIRNHI